MALKTSVKVGNITHLSDARYCAGMGVEMLGFQAVENQPNYISPERYQEIRGWVTGPKIVAEVYGLLSPDQLDNILHNYQPDLLELPVTILEFIQGNTLPILIALNSSEFEDVKSILDLHKDTIFALILPAETSTSDLRYIAGFYPIILRVMDAFDSDVLALPITGIALEGTQEERPGLKNYEALAHVLELLDED